MPKSLLLFITFILLGLFLFIAAIMFILFQPSVRVVPQTAVIQIKNVKVSATIAKTWEQKTQGLSGVQFLRENEGMLFVYSIAGRYGIWMKDMNFAIDIIWIDKDLKVIDFVQNATPESFPKSFKPSSPALYILEVNAGFVKENDIQAGDALSLLN